MVGIRGRGEVEKALAQPRRGLDLGELRWAMLATSSVLAQRSRSTAGVLAFGFWLVLW